jgi:hypothetical protein
MTFSGKGSPLDHAGIDAFTGVNTYAGNQVLFFLYYNILIFNVVMAHQCAFMDFAKC